MSTLRTNALEGVDAKNSITIVAGAGNVNTTNVQEGLSKAWVNANDDSSLDDSFNISSNLDNTTGDYTYSFTNNTNNTNFCITSICIDNNAEICHNNSRATSSYGIRIKEGDDGSTARDRPQSGTMHGDLA